MNRKRKLGPRNPLVAPAMFRKAGAHVKSNKAMRRADIVNINRRLTQQVEYLAFNQKERVRASRRRPLRLQNNEIFQKVSIILMFLFRETHNGVRPGC